MKKIIALVMVCMMALALFGCGKSTAVKETERLIDGIGEVTVDSEEAIEAAEAAYEALSEKDREQVSNYAALTDARQALEAAQLEALRQSVVGTWQTKLDVTDAMVEELDAQFTGIDISFGDYLKQFDFVMVLELKEDGAYALKPDPAGMEPSMQNLREAMEPFIRDYLRAYMASALEESGIEGDFSTLEGLEAAIGMDLDSAVKQSLGMSISDYVDTLMDEMDMDTLFADTVDEGTYTVEPGKLQFSDESEPTDFTLEGDTLRLKVPEENNLFGLTELAFTRVG